MEARKLSSAFIDFINQCPTPFHVVQFWEQSLNAAGFIQLKESQSWIQLERGRKYYFSRNGSSLVAFCVPKNFSHEESAFNIIITHTDFPCLKLAPISLRSSGGYQSLNIVPYGGGLWHTWFDRDLTLAGRITIINENNKLENKLIKISKPLLRIPSLAIHFHRERQKFEWNEETTMKPIFATEMIAQLFNEGSQKNDRHPKGLIRYVSELLQVKQEQMTEIDMWVVDAQPATTLGIYDEFVSAGKCDNLLSTFTALTSLINFEGDGKNIQMVAAFDNEEIGSETQQGAMSNLLPSTIQRIVELIEGEKKVDTLNTILLRSFIVSCDTAHALHPNYMEQYQLQGAPHFHKGTVIKYPSYRGNYATDCSSSAFIKLCAQKAKVPVQEFFMKADKIGGSTVGPITTAKTGIKTVDIGNPQLAMHSIREMISVKDIELQVKLFLSFFDSNYEEHNI